MVGLNEIYKTILHTSIGQFKQCKEINIFIKICELDLGIGRNAVDESSDHSFARNTENNNEHELTWEHRSVGGCDLARMI